MPDNLQRILLLIFQFVLSVLYTSEAQVLSNQEKEVWNARVKQLNQFISRFNYVEEVNYFPNIGKQLERPQYVASLFSSEVVNTTPRDSLLKFVNQVCNVPNPQYLSIRDKNWYAKVKCKAIYQSKTIDVILTLMIQENANKSVEWVIVGGQSKSLDTKKNEESIHLTANANELNFLRLPVNLENPNNAFNLLSSNYLIDNLSIILFLIKTNQLKIQHVQEITYHFLQIPDWIFSVKEINNSSLNSGWLIYELQYASQAKKNEYLVNKLYLTDKEFFLGAIIPDYESKD